MSHNSENPVYIYGARWNAPAKFSARFKSLIETYCKIFGVSSIPKDGQFWTLSGAQCCRGIEFFGELAHVLYKNLIRIDQYFGVERELEIIDQNKKFWPTANWIHGDFLKVMENAVMEGKFNPSIINYDGVMQPVNSSNYLKKILNLIDYNVSGELMLVASYVLTNPYNCNSDKLKFTVHDILEELRKVYNMPVHWTVYPESFAYKHSIASMGIVVFVKQKHDIKNIKITPNYTVGHQGGESIGKEACIEYVCGC